tara:strand:+ start:413 stop:574 length:162 start_codon:yes stop_codon:yes gene_type:complete
MLSKNKQNKELQKKFIEPLNGLDFCEVSKASAEIMLERFCNGKDICFPFSQKL